MASDSIDHHFAAALNTASYHEQAPGVVGAAYPLLHIESVRYVALIEPGDPGADGQQFSVKTNHCIFLGGPIDGKRLSIPDHSMDWIVTESLPEIDPFAASSIEEVFKPAFFKSRYIRTSSRTFIHETESNYST